MKISIDIDCTPTEARIFLGLPDVTPLHDAYLDRMKGFISDGLTPADFERLAKAWLPGFGDGIQQFGQTLWNAATGTGTKKSEG